MQELCCLFPLAFLAIFAFVVCLSGDILGTFIGR